jgi:hypothetical protein
MSYAPHPHSVASYLAVASTCSSPNPESKSHTKNRGHVNKDGRGKRDFTPKLGEKMNTKSET